MAAVGWRAASNVDRPSALPERKVKLAIIGGGWAGMSAAVSAAQLGYQVCVHEAAGALGGRARSVHSPSLDATIDNGQHILLGAYEATLALMRSLGLDPEQRFHRLPLNVCSADGNMRIMAPSVLPAPLNVACALLTARGLTVAEKRAAFRAMTDLRRRGWKMPAGSTVKQWLQTAGQPERLQRLLWVPLCIATLNTPVEAACAQLFANVLRDSLGAPQRTASDMLIPRMGLSELWPHMVEVWAQGQSGAAMAAMNEPQLYVHRSSHVRALHDASHGITLDVTDDTYDAVIVCTNTPAAGRLLATLPPRPGSEDFLAQIDAFEHAPIATLTVELERPWRLPKPMLFLHEHRGRRHFGQWVFQGQDEQARLLHIVVSDADALLEVPREQAVAGMLEQLREQMAAPDMPRPGRTALIVEKRATFKAVPGLRRPGNQTPWPRVWVAGDWTDTGYPAVLEGAVRSGRDAVRALNALRKGA